MRRYLPFVSSIIPGRPLLATSEEIRARLRESTSRAMTSRCHAVVLQQHFVVLDAFPLVVASS